MVELPAAMIGDHHSIDAAFARDAGILRGDQALHHELSLPAPAYQFDMLPGELVAIADIAHEILGQDGWTARRVHILEMRHAVIFQRAHPGAEQPMRMRRYIPGDPRCDQERDLEAGANVVLAVRGNRHVGGHHEGIVAGGGDPLDELLDARRIARQIRLVPGGRVCPPNVLELDQ